MLGVAVVHVRMMAVADIVAGLVVVTDVVVVMIAVPDHGVLTVGHLVLDTTLCFLLRFIQVIAIRVEAVSPQHGSNSRHEVVGSHPRRLCTMTTCFTLEDIYCILSSDTCLLPGQETLAKV